MSFNLPDNNLIFKFNNKLSVNNTDNSQQNLNQSTTFKRKQKQKTVKEKNELKFENEQKRKIKAIKTEQAKKIQSNIEDLQQELDKILYEINLQEQLLKQKQDIPYMYPNFENLKLQKKQFQDKIKILKSEKRSLHSNSKLQRYNKINFI